MQRMIRSLLFFILLGTGVHVLSNPLSRPAPEQPDLWEYIADNFTLSHHVDNPRVKDQTQWFLNHQSFLITASRQAAPYMFYINQVAEKQQIPGELVLLPIIESAFDPFAHSIVGAAGLWQFMPETASGVGIKQNWWFDGRRDITVSTKAAMDYLAYLHHFFHGDWLLAIAAYNAGTGTVSKAMRANQEAGLPVDFWSLKLPQETRIYVPRLLALAAIVSEPSKYHAQVPRMPALPYFAEVDVGFQIDLTEAARLAEINLNEFYQLNAGYNRWTTDPDGPHTLLLPIQKLKNFEANLLNHFGKHTNVTTYTVKQNDTLETISQQFAITVPVLKNANHLTSNEIEANQTLIIPKNTYFVSLKAHYLNLQSRVGQLFKRFEKQDYYTVKSGDTIWKIAKQFNVPVKDIVALNTKSNGGQFVLHAGQTLRLKKSIPTKKQPDLTPSMPYFVAQGDSLHSIAKRYHTNVEQLKHNNGLESERLKVGQVLYIPSGNAVG